MGWRTTEHLARRGLRMAVLTDAERPSDLLDVPWPVYGSAAELPHEGPGFRPDIVHVYDLAMPAHAALGRDLARRFGARLAITPASAPGAWPDRGLGARLCAEAHVVYALTAAETRALRSLCDLPVRVVGLPQAPDLTGQPDAGRFRREHRLDGRIVLFLGRKLAAKGYRTLLAAAPLVWRHSPDTTFVFCGPEAEPGANEAFRQARDGRIRDLGVLTDQAKHDALAACDVLALPSTLDVFPLVFAEAWWCGKPVLSGGFDGADKVVRDGVDGLVVEPQPVEVADALVRLLTDDDLRTALGAAGRSRVRGGMGWDRVAQAVAAGYR
ncbi:glycosyltransferase family 4 protein [Streptomyces europaeiscabiei]|uniref:glycosyltransferase family 4 protein n=1 Tax=Streptomyces europaeiscabiei TaxID=146819 RepID=UPI0029C0756F|nr:glycosyltransferase family 4 protein [Streptomyces europaeiscabiei]